MKGERLNLRTGKIVSNEELELYEVTIELFVNGSWKESTRSLPLNIIKELESGQINKIADDDDEEVAARMPF